MSALSLPVDVCETTAIGRLNLDYSLLRVSTDIAQSGKLWVQFSIPSLASIPSSCLWCDEAVLRVLSHNFDSLPHMHTDDYLAL